MHAIRSYDLLYFKIMCKVNFFLIIMFLNLIGW